MMIPMFLLSLGLNSAQASFQDFDTTVRVKTYTSNSTDSTFIKLRNTGFELSYTLTKTAECPNRIVVGDFELRPKTGWPINFTTVFGDSSYTAQTVVVYFCNYQLFGREIKPLGARYLKHLHYDGTTKVDSIFTRVKSIVDDSTFILSVSALPFQIQSTTAINRDKARAKHWVRRDAVRIDGRLRTGSSKIFIDENGNKSLDLK